MRLPDIPFADVTPTRFGWSVGLGYRVHHGLDDDDPWLEMDSPPYLWRPTYRWARWTARRRLNRINAKTARQAATVRMEGRS